jgi:prepilin-type N-terminal cleavage/methylation domain-containing protein
MRLLSKRHRRGFTLIEMVIVVLVITVLIAIAIPSYQTARESARKRSCLANLRSIFEAKEHYAAEKRLSAGDDISLGDLVPDFMRTIPTCPSGGQYSLDSIGQYPKCSHASHAPD